MRALSVGVVRAAEQLELSSVHVLFPRASQATALAELGFEPRYGIQYHWRNAGYQNFEDFLARYRSKQRNQIRRERRELELQNLEIEVLTGTDLTPVVVDQLYQFYLSTVDKYAWGRRYLNREFFEELCSKQKHDVLAVMARERGSSRYVASAFNLLGSKRLFGRYWGASADYKCLHFNLCYYAGIEQCIARGLSVFEPGAGGEHKVARGFEPTLTYSVHYLADKRLRTAVSQYLSRERELVQERLQAEPGPLRPLPEFNG
jgi:predicted N-acyltransferase